MKAKFLLWALIFISFWGCSHSEVSASHEETDVTNANITYIASTNGIGDNGYNDNLLAGLLRFNEDTGIPVQLIQPTSLDDARKAAKTWLQEHSTDESSLLALASSEYDTIAKEIGTSIPAQNRVLLFEADSQGIPSSVTTFIIDRYGASYLAGAIVGKFSSVIFASSPDFPNLETSIEGFKDGYNAHKVVTDTPSVIYVSKNSKDEPSFSNITGAYTAVMDLLEKDLHSPDPVKVIFPLLGESNVGAFRAIEDFAFTLDLIVGMDTDKSGVSSRVPFSLVVNTRDIFLEYLNDWKSGKSWPHHRVFSMADSATAIVWNENFDIERFWFPEDSTDSFKARYNKYYDEAIQMEEKHVNK